MSVIHASVSSKRKPERRRRVAVLARGSRSRTPPSSNSPSGQVADDDVLLLERDRDGTARARRRSRIRGSACRRAARPGPQIVVCGHSPSGREVGEAGDVVEVEVGEQDVESLDAVEQLGRSISRADAGPGVDHDRRVAVAQQRAGGLAAVRREPAASPRIVSIARAHYAASPAREPCGAPVTLTRGRRTSLVASAIRSSSSCSCLRSSAIERREQILLGAARQLAPTRQRLAALLGDVQRVRAAVARVAAGARRARAPRARRSSRPSSSDRCRCTCRARAG